MRRSSFPSRGVSSGPRHSASTVLGCPEDVAAHRSRKARAGSGGAGALKDSEFLHWRCVKQRQPVLFSLPGKGGWFPF